ncbi:MAG: restriction endonuclease subunit S [Roseiflexaceae bacterium]|nr:restriction endonuclease subunit S [Roseiflexus sp.]MDW8234020.1 restriction endonuclease subunit S [Roseiflexaceae bacterium]
MEIQWQLPPDWEAVKLELLAREDAVQIRPSDHPTTIFNYWGLDVIEKGQFSEPQPNWVSGAEIASVCVRFDSRHVLYSKLRPYLNKVIVPSVEGIGTTEWIVLRPNPGLVDRHYLAYVLRSESFVAYATAKSTGARMPRVRKDAFWEAPIPLPYPDDPARSLETQRWIVARLDALLAEVAAARRLHAEIAADMARVMEAVRDEIFSELANHAPKVQFSDIADSRLGKMLSQSSKRGMYSKPYLRNANVLWDEFKLDDVYEMDFLPEEREEFLLKPGDLLICEGGEIGRCAVWEGQIEECYFQKALHRARLKDKQSSPRYLMHFIAWAAERGDIAKLRTGSAIPHLTGVKLNTLKVIWPKREVQYQVAATLDQIKTEIAQMQVSQTENSALLDQTEQTILAHAFRGEL